MKRPRKLVLREKSVLSESGLKPENWLVRGTDENYLYVVHRVSGKERAVRRHEKAPLPASKKGRK